VQPGRYEIESAATGKVLDLRREDMRSVQQYYRGNVRNQQWDIESAGRNEYFIRSAENGAYLGVEGNWNGGRVVATGGNRQSSVWRFVDVGNGNVMIVNRSGMALDLPNGSSQDGVLMQVWNQAMNSNQQFRLVPLAVGASYPNDPWFDTSSMTAAQRRNYEEGYQLGQRDARFGYNSNYQRYSDRYNRRQESYFRRGYEAGYSGTGNSGDQFDLSQLSQSERRVYDDAYRLGQRDARAGYSMDFRRYSNRYNARQQPFFQRGYEVGYNRVQRF
jgi:hypothetical protein